MVRRPSKILFVGVLSGLLLLALGPPLYNTILKEWRPTGRLQRKMLFQTDHQRLLAACRLLWQIHLKGDNRPVTLDESPTGSLLRTVTDMNPRTIDSYPSGITIEMGGPGCHYGFETYFADPASDKDRAKLKDAYPSKQLTAELWYYAENGVVEPRH
jgi:hypothetical protein